MNAFNPSAQEATAPLLWTVRYGVVSAIASTHPAVRSLQMYGEWGEAEIDLLSTVIQDGQTVLQFGGEFGAQTLWLARVVGAKGCVHVAEPARIGFQQLCASVALNGLTNVYTVNQWLGQRGGSAGLGTLPGAQHFQGDAAEKVKLGTVDELGLDSLHLLKINAPGTAVQLLDGAVETIRRCRPILYFRLEPEQAVSEVKLVKELGYRCWSHAPHMYNPENALGQAENIFPGRVHQNLIAVPVESGTVFEQLMEV